MSVISFDFEKDFWNKGLSTVAGADEVGRGCFAGPVVAACVVFPKDEAINAHYKVSGRRLELKFQNSSSYVYINDSKKLDHRARLRAGEWIKFYALAWGVGQASVGEINRLGLGKSTHRAFRRAMASLLRKMQQGTVDRLLVDAFYVPHLNGLSVARQTAIVRGDAKSFSIAAASIIAKVYRDSLMTRLSGKKEYKCYMWDRNKGYCTRQHKEAILKYGVTKHHRKKFIETFLSKRGV